MEVKDRLPRPTLHLTGRVVDIAHDAGAAAHVRNLGLGVAGFVVLQVKRRVNEREVGEQPLGTDAAGQLEEVVVGVTRIIADALFDAENLDGENRGLAVPQARLSGQQNIL